MVEGAGARRRVLVRVLFGLLPVVLVGQVAVQQLVGEPYPALFQPSFGGGTPRDDVAETTDPRVVATYADGTTRTFDHRVVMAQAKTLQSRVFDSAFGWDSPRRDDPAVRAWLQARLTALGDGSPATAARVIWRDTDHDLTGRRPPVSRTGHEVDIPLEVPRG